LRASFYFGDRQIAVTKECVSWFSRGCSVLVAQLSLNIAGMSVRRLYILPNTGFLYCHSEGGYWWFWVLVIPIEAIAAAAILHAWFPAVQTWEFAIAVTGLLTLTNTVQCRALWRIRILVRHAQGHCRIGLYCAWHFCPDRWAA
jgi:hypothetical protein